MTYTFADVNEMAAFFLSQAGGCRHRAGKAKTEKQRQAEQYAASAWELAAEIAEHTVFETAIKQKAA
jgi:hypothetical protein